MPTVASRDKQQRRAAQAETLLFERRRLIEHRSDHHPAHRVIRQPIAKHQHRRLRQHASGVCRPTSGQQTCERCARAPGLACEHDTKM
jgi:hypothetical protein